MGDSVREEEQHRGETRVERDDRSDWSLEDGGG